MTLLNCTLFTKTKTPLFLRILLIRFIMLSGRILTIQELNWPFIAIVIIFLGGIIVVFVYASSLNFNNKNLMSANARVGLLWVFIFLIIAQASARKGLIRIAISSAGLYTSPALSILLFIGLYLLAALLSLIKVIR